MNDLIIYGAGGFGREVAWLVERINQVSPTWNLLGFIDENESLKNTALNGYRVLGGREVLGNNPDAYYVVAVGASKIREKIVNGIWDAYPDIRFATVIDPSVEMSKQVSIGEGSIICAHTIITVNVSIGNHVIINLDCTVGHDAIIKDFSTVYPSANISGAARIGYAAELGTGMQIIQGKAVGDYSIIGAGATVVNDIPEGCTAVGCPARAVNFSGGEIHPSFRFTDC